MPRYAITSTSKMHGFIEEFGDDKDKVLMMMKLKTLRRYIQNEVAKEYDLAIKTARSATENIY